MKIKLKPIGFAKNQESQLLDIKPYTPQYDAVLEAKVPDWVNKLDY